MADRWDMTLPKGYVWVDEMLPSKFLQPKFTRAGETLEIRMGYQPSDEYYKHSDLVGCSHEWVNVGFHFDKHVCKKCNKDKA